MKLRNNNWIAVTLTLTQNYATMQVEWYCAYTVMHHTYQKYMQEFEQEYIFPRIKILQHHQENQWIRP